MEDIKQKLIQLTDCKYIKFVKRGNKAIQYALRIAKQLGKSKVLIQDQGGWITYNQYPRKMDLELIKLKTDFGLIDKDILFKNADKDSVLMINSMPGYLALEDMKTIENICKEKGCLIINDITGSIGTENAKYGDIIVCSFGKDKPLAVGEGALIGVKEPDYFDIIVIEEITLPESIKVDTLKERLEAVDKIRKKVIEDLKDLNIIHKQKGGINLAVKFADEQEKEKIINYCDSKNLEYTICPRYIRVECDAISIEIKRLFTDDKYKKFKGD